MGKNISLSTFAGLALSAIGTANKKNRHNKDLYNNYNDMFTICCNKKC